MDKNARRKLWIAAAAVGSVLLALVIAWKFTPLKDVVSATAVIDWLESISEHWWTPVLIVALYTPAAMIMFPRPVLTIAAVAVFGFLQGLAFAMAGVLLSAIVFYYAGRRIERKKLERIAGPRMARLSKMMQKEGFVAVTVVGLLPVAPFPIEMLVAGALRLKLHHVLGGVFLAMLPGMLGTTVLGQQFLAAMHEGRQMNRWIVGVTIALLVALGWFTHRWWKRVQAQL